MQVAVLWLTDETQISSQPRRRPVKQEITSRMNLLFVLPFISSLPLLTGQQVDETYLDLQYKDLWGRQLAGVDACTSKAFDRFRQPLIDDFQTGWEELMEYDWASTRSYLTREKGYPLSVVHWMETRNSGTGGYDRAFSEVSPEDTSVHLADVTLKSNS
jgi:hypothetical protein